MSTVETCDRCGIALDNVFTGIVWVHLKDSPTRQNRMRLCSACAKIVVETEGATEIARAKSITKPGAT
jgi:hypothetical protein